ncbi:ABC transporter substrate-binding protein [Candidatus Gracilibacteria bacterium]|nr:ABC transporter substrate-binding protein [Candidatus Gracilibacteria bacterium]
MKKLSIFVSLLLVLTSCGAPEKSENPSSSSQKEIIKVGVIAPLSGPAVSYGTDAVNTYTYSVDAYNASQDEVEVQLVIEDGKCNGKDSVSAVQKLIHIDQVAFILGGICSGETIAAGKIAQAKKVVMLSPTSSSPEVSNIGDYIFRYWNDAHAGITLAEHLNENHPNIALVVESTDYAKSLSNNLKQNYTGNIVEEINFASDEKDYGIIVNNIEKTSFDALVFLNQTESTGISMINALKEKGLLDKYGKENIIGAYLFSGENFIESVGSDTAKGLTQVNIDFASIENDRAISFIEDFKKNYEIAFAANFMYLEKEAIDFILESISSGVRDSEGLKAALESITADNKRDGYFGTYYIDEFGDAIGLSYTIETVE